MVLIRMGMIFCLRFSIFKISILDGVAGSEPATVGHALPTMLSFTSTPRDEAEFTTLCLVEKTLLNLKHKNYMHGCAMPLIYYSQ